MRLEKKLQLDNAFPTSDSSPPDNSLPGGSGRKHISLHVRELSREELELALLRSIDQAVHVDAEFLQTKAELEQCKRELGLRWVLARAIRVLFRKLRGISR